MQSKIFRKRENNFNKIENQTNENLKNMPKVFLPLSDLVATLESFTSSVIHAFTSFQLLSNSTYIHAQKPHSFMLQTDGSVMRICYSAKEWNARIHKSSVDQFEYTLRNLLAKLYYYN